jgi:hypothetical protein
VAPSRRLLSRRQALAATASLGGFACAAAIGKEGNMLRAGAAATDITPALGVSLTGTILQIGPTRSIHDPLHARALVMDDGSTRLAIAVTDVTMVAADVLDKAKALAHERTGIHVEHMLISATHTHAAPRMIGIGEAEADKEYYDLYCRRVAQAIEQAANDLAPAAVGWGTADVPQFPKNRRWRVKPGAMPPNPFGATDDQVLMYGNRKGIGVEPAGPVDPELAVLSVRRADGTPLAVLANYSIHYVGGYGRAEVSADYFGCFPRAIARELGAQDATSPVVGILANGTSGNIGGIGGGYAAMKRVAGVLAKHAARICREAKHRRDASLDMRQSQLELAIRRPDAERLEWARTAPRQPRTKGTHPWRDIYAREALLLAKYPPKVTITLQAIRIGELAIAAIPCEVFAETGLAIKTHSPLQPTFTIGLANGYHGYLPTPEQHALGGYETWPARSSCLEVQAEPKIRAATRHLLQHLARR